MTIFSAATLRYQNVPRWLRALLIITLLSGCYAAAGFWIVPAWLQKSLPEYTQSLLGRDGHVSDIRINPFTLSIEIDDLTISQNNKNILSWQKLRTNLDPWRFITTDIWIINTLEIQNLQIDIERSSDGKFNFSDIIERLTAQRSNEADIGNTPEKTEPAAVLIENLAINNLAINYHEKRTANKDFTYQINGDIRGSNITTGKNQYGTLSTNLKLNKTGTLTATSSLQLQPLQLAGNIAIDNAQLPEGFAYIAEQFRFTLASGALKADLPFNVENNQLQLNHASAEIQSLRIDDPQHNNQPAATLPTILLRGISADSKQRRIAIKTIEAAQATVDITLNADREILLLKLLQPVNTSAKPIAAADNDSSWQFTLDALAIKNWTLKLTDELPATPVKLTLAPFNLDIEQFSSATQTLNVAMNTQLDSGGTVALNGPLTLSPFGTQLTIAIDNVNVLPSQPYWQNLLHIDLLNGHFSTQATLDLKLATDNSPIIMLQGNAAINDIKTRERSNKRPLLNWKQTRLEELRFSNSPLALSIQKITSDEMYARIIINNDRSINLQNLVTKQSAKKPAKKTTRNNTTAKDSGPTQPFTLSIADIELVNSRVDFSDYTIIPNFTAGIQQLEGHITDIGENQKHDKKNSARKKQQAKIDLTGRIDAYAPVTILGQFNANSFSEFADIAINFRNIDMTKFTPYSGTFAGYKIEKGKLTVDLHYLIENRQLTAQNGIFMDQLTLGEPVSSSSATSLPVKLAISLLKNNKGEIDIDLPISGDIDNPSFSVKSLLTKAVVNLITQTVSAPFKLLSSLVGSSSELNTISFPAGLATLEKPELDKLQLLGEALQKRPELYLEIARTVHPQRDILALRAVKNPTAVKDTSSNPDTAETAMPEPVISAVEEELLRDLAIDRAQLIRSTLETHGVKPKRLYITDKIEKTAEIDNGMIDVELKLSSK